jgi:hypothetical protein
MTAAYIRTNPHNTTAPPRPHLRHTPAWDRIRREIEVERRMLRLIDPYSVRIRPSVAPVGWGL